MTEHDEGAMKELADALEAERKRSAKLEQTIDRLSEGLRHYANRENWKEDYTGRDSDEPTEDRYVYQGEGNGYDKAAEVLSECGMGEESEQLPRILRG